MDALVLFQIHFLGKSFIAPLKITFEGFVSGMDVHVVQEVVPLPENLKAVQTTTPVEMENPLCLRIPNSVNNEVIVQWCP